jgi:hypothetical protein
LFSLNNDADFIDGEVSQLLGQTFVVETENSSIAGTNLDHTVAAHGCGCCCRGLGVAFVVRFFVKK